MSAAQMPIFTKSRKQSQYKRHSETADGLTFLILFSVISQKHLLNQENNNKQKNVRTWNRKFTIIKEELHVAFFIIYMLILFSWYLIERQFSKFKKHMVRTSTIYFLILITAILWLHTMQIKLLINFLSTYCYNMNSRFYPRVYILLFNQKSLIKLLFTAIWDKIATKGYF